MPRLGQPMSAEQKAKIAETLRARGLSPTKRCPQCEEVKPREEFLLRPNGHSRSYCRACEIVRVRGWQAKNQQRVRDRNRRVSLKRWFGITVEVYDAMLVAQGGVCAICGGTEPSRNGYLYVDHCHSTNVIRGLLCSRCNSAIGLLRDDPDQLRKAMAYLEAPPFSTPCTPSR